MGYRILKKILGLIVGLLLATNVYADDWTFNPFSGELDNQGINQTSADALYLKLDGSNANQNINIGAWNFTTTGLGTLGSLIVDTPTLAVNVAGYTDKIGFGTADPDNTWEFSDGTPTGTFAGIGMLLRNPTAADGTTTFRQTPGLILSSQGKGATNQQYQWAQAMAPSGSADNLTFRYSYKFGAGSWTFHPFYLDTSNGFVILGLANAEDPHKAPNVLLLLNSTAATSTVDQYSPPISWASQGWKTEATAGTQYMGLLQCNAPEKGTISPIGVHKWMYAINTYGNSTTESNELMRFQWGSDAGVTGIIINSKILADFHVGIGVTSPTAYLHLGTGTATANTAPLKFTAGTDLTAIEAGAVEYSTNLLKIRSDSFGILSDTYKLLLGAGSDMDMIYDGTNGYIHTDLVAASDLTIDCGTAKTLVLEVSVYNDINISGYLLGKPTANYPGTDTFRTSTPTDTGIETYAFAVDEKVHGGFELQHDYKEGTDLVFHVHFQIIDAPSGTDKVQWRLTYVVMRDGVTLTTVTTIDSADTSVDTQYRAYRTDFGAIIGTTYKIGDQFMFTLTRVAPDGDVFLGDCLIETAGIHYQCDTLGSRAITTK